MPAQELKFRLINILLLSVVLVSSGCFGGDGNSNQESDESDQESELTIPDKKTIEEEVIGWWERRELRIPVEGCSKYCSSNNGEKKPKKVKILKTGKLQKGKPTPNSEREKKYWPVRVEIKGICDKAENMMDECTEGEFTVKGDYNVYKNDFGEWKATFSN